MGQPHLRRVVRSGLAALRNVAEAILAHRPPGFVGVYDLHEYEDEKREALEKWAARVHLQVGFCRARLGRQAARAAAMMARQIAARGRLCAGAGWTRCSGSPALAD